MTVKIFIDAADAVRERAGYAIDVLFEGVGLPVARAASAADADVVYSAEKPAGNALWLRATRSREWDGDDVEVVEQDGMPCIAARGEGCADLVRSAYSYLTGAPERLSPRDWAGRPIGTPEFRAFGLHRTPVVARYVEWLERGLPPDLLRGRVARWPNGKKYAVVLSHDVDGPFSSVLPSYAWGWTRRLAADGAWGGVPRAALSFVKAAVTYRGNPRRDPNLRFADWIDVARSLGGRQTFYVAVRSAAEKGTHPLDVSYDFRHPALLGELRGAIERGAEIGIHASIHAKLSQDAMTEERERLRDALGGYDVRGLRHHYWATDPESSERTSWLHAAAGFDYDSSMGLNDSPGFRRGMVWPFHPFDRERARRLPVLQVPPTMMDGGVFYRDVTAEEGEGEMRAHFAEVFARGGAAVLDWHMEQMNPTRLRGAGPLLVKVLRDLAEDSAVWWPSAAQVADWWRERRRAIEERGRTA